jgi:hypothetical protein
MGYQVRSAPTFGIASVDDRGRLLSVWRLVICLNNDGVQGGALQNIFLNPCKDPDSG